MKRSRTSKEWLSLRSLGIQEQPSPMNWRGSLRSIAVMLTRRCRQLIRTERQSALLKHHPGLWNMRTSTTMNSGGKSRSRHLRSHLSSREREIRSYHSFSNSDLTHLTNGLQQEKIPKQPLQVDPREGARSKRDRIGAFQLWAFQEQTIRISSGLVPSMKDRSGSLRCTSLVLI